MIVVLLLVLTVLPKKVEILKRFSGVSFFIYFFIILLVAFQASSYHAFNKLSHNEVELYNFNSNLTDVLGSIGMAIFAYNCLTSFYMVSNSLNNPTTKRLRFVFCTTFSMIFLVIVLTGLSGWITFGKSKS